MAESKKDLEDLITGAWLHREPARSIKLCLTSRPTSITNRLMNIESLLNVIEHEMAIVHSTGDHGDMDAMYEGFEDLEDFISVFNTWTIRFETLKGKAEDLNIGLSCVASDIMSEARAATGKQLESPADAAQVLNETNDPALYKLQESIAQRVRDMKL